MGGATCDTAGIIQPAVQMVVAHQVTEAMKILVNDFQALRGTMLSFDIWNNQYISLKVNRQKKSTCPSCGNATHLPKFNIWITDENRSAMRAEYSSNPSRDEASS